MSTPPIFSTANLPGGPWRLFARRTRVAAVRVLGHFQWDDGTGTLTDYPDGAWVAIIGGTPQVVDPTTFSGVYDDDGA